MNKKYEFACMLIECNRMEESALVWFPGEICLDAAKEFISLFTNGDLYTFTLDLGVSNWVFGVEGFDAWEEAECLRLSGN